MCNDFVKGLKDQQPLSQILTILLDLLVEVVDVYRVVWFDISHGLGEKYRRQNVDKQSNEGLFMQFFKKRKTDLRRFEDNRTFIDLILFILQNNINCTKPAVLL